MRGGPSDRFEAAPHAGLGEIHFRPRDSLWLLKLERGSLLQRAPSLPIRQRHPDGGKRVGSGGATLKIGEKSTRTGQPFFSSLLIKRRTELEAGVIVKSRTGFVEI